MMRFALFQEVFITQDIREANLKAGDVAMLIDYVRHPHGGEDGAVLEVFNAVGDSISVATVPVSVLAPLRPDQVPSVRERLQAA